MCLELEQRDRSRPFSANLIRTYMTDPSQEREVGPAAADQPPPPSVAARRGFLGRGARAGVGVGLAVLTVHHRRSLAETVDISSPEACASMGGTFEVVDEIDSATGASFSYKVCHRSSLGIFTGGSGGPAPRP